MNPTIRLCGVSLAAVCLASCASLTGTTVSQTLERADTDAASAYSTVATLANAYEVAHPLDTPRAEALKLQAWSLFTKEHQAYLVGQSVDVSGALAALVAAAKGL